MEMIRKYFPGISPVQEQQFVTLAATLRTWNEKINVISRKDTDHIEERHILHSLAIAKYITFNPGSTILDAGTGGGFPGLPLAILHPGSTFTLVDSISKKIRVVETLIEATGLVNTKPLPVRVETLTSKFDFVVSRAVTAFPRFYKWTRPLISEHSLNQIPNGIIYLKGGDLGDELSGFQKGIRITPISKWFMEEWFLEKKIVYMQVGRKEIENTAI